MATHPVTERGTTAIGAEELDVRVLAGAFVFAPVLLALLILLLSLSSWSTHLAFEEGAPGSWLSLSMILGVLLLVMPAVRNQALEPERRRAALVLSVALVVALFDEKRQWHERIGLWIFNMVDRDAYPWMVHADDVMIILFAFLGTALLWRLMRALPDARDYIPYLGLIGAAALAHGVFDLLDHREYIWQVFWPEATFDSLRPLRNVLGFFEEAMKLWTEYFVALLFLHFFHRQTGHLMWTALVLIGSFMATAGLWSVVDDPFVPYMILRSELGFLRNYALFFPLAFVWITWTVIVWRWFSADTGLTAFAGLFFLWPLVQAPAWLLLVFGGALGLAMRSAWRPAPRVRGAIVAGLIVTFGLALGLSQRSYLTQRRFDPPESVLFETGRQIILDSDR